MDLLSVVLASTTVAVLRMSFELLISGHADLTKSRIISSRECAAPDALSMGFADCDKTHITWCSVPVVRSSQF